MPEIQEKFPDNYFDVNRKDIRCCLNSILQNTDRTAKPSIELSVLCFNPE